jgi:hypothetical protein
MPSSTLEGSFSPCTASSQVSRWEAAGWSLGAQGQESTLPCARCRGGRHHPRRRRFVPQLSCRVYAAPLAQRAQHGSRPQRVQRAQHDVRCSARRGHMQRASRFTHPPWLGAYHTVRSRVRGGYLPCAHLCAARGHLTRQPFMRSSPLPVPAQAAARRGAAGHACRRLPAHDLPRRAPGAPSHAYGHAPRGGGRPQRRG